MRIVGGVWGGRRIAAPAGRETRPTTDRVREAWMSAISREIEGAKVVDLFAGSGALGIEALSRGAEHATFVESSAGAMAVLRRNLAELGVPASSFALVRSDVFRYLDGASTGAFHIAFADPPYASDTAGRLAERFAERPFARLLCIEHSRADTLVGDAVWERRYGDTLLTFFRAPDDDVQPEDRDLPRIVRPDHPGS